MEVQGDEQIAPKDGGKTAQRLAVVAELQVGFAAAGVERLPGGRLPKRQGADFQQVLVSRLRIRVVGVVAGEEVVEPGDVGFVSAVIGAATGDAGGAPSNEGGELIAAELAIVLNEVANDGIKALLFGDVKGERSVAEVSGEGEAQQRLTLRDGVIGAAAGKKAFAGEEARAFKISQCCAAVVGEDGE